MQRDRKMAMAKSGSFDDVMKKLARAAPAGLISNKMKETLISHIYQNPTIEN